MPVESLLKMAQVLADKQLQKVGGLTIDALLVLLDILQARGEWAAADTLLQGPCQQAVDLPGELIRLKVQIRGLSSQQVVIILAKLAHT